MANVNWMGFIAMGLSVWTFKFCYSRMLEQSVEKKIAASDPLRGLEHISAAEFRKRYHFTGFYMSVSR